MSEVEYATEVTVVDSIVIPKFQSEIRARELKVSADCPDYLFSQVRRNLNEAHRKGELEELRNEIEQNTVRLVERCVELQGFEELQGTEIDIALLNETIASLCSEFEYFFPFCPRR